MPDINFPEPPSPDDKEGLDRWRVEIHNRVVGLGAGNSGDLDDENVDFTEARKRSTHTGTQTASTISDFETEVLGTHTDISGNHSLLKEATDPTDASGATATALTDSTGGSKDNDVGAIPAVGGSGATLAQETLINNNFAEVTDEINALINDVAEVRNKLNTLFANLRTAGIID